MSQLISSPELSNLLAGSHLLVDTCALVDMSKNAEFRDYIFSLKDMDCTLTSILPVQTEFLSVASTRQEQSQLADFLKSCELLYTVGIEHKIQSSRNHEETSPEASNFMIALRRSQVRNPSYVDFLLLFMPYFYHQSVDNIYLMTSNHKDIPLEFYDRVGLVVCDNGKAIHEEGVYHFNLKKFNKIVS